VNTKQLKTLQLIFHQPTTTSLKFSDVESLVIALGGSVEERSGSRIRIELNSHTKCRSKNMNSMTYKGYTAKLEYDDRDSIFVGRVLGLRSILSFEGNSVELLKTAFEDAINDYLKECQDKGQNPEKPASGKLLLRLAPELHGQAMVAAKAADKSLNQWVAEVLHQAVRS